MAAYIIQSKDVTNNSVAITHSLYIHYMDYTVEYPYMGILGTGCEALSLRCPYFRVS